MKKEAKGEEVNPEAKRGEVGNTTRIEPDRIFGSPGCIVVRYPKGQLVTIPEAKGGGFRVSAIILYLVFCGT